MKPGVLSNIWGSPGWPSPGCAQRDFRNAAGAASALSQRGLPQSRLSQSSLSSSSNSGTRSGMVLFEVIIALFIFVMVAFSLVIALTSAFDAAKDRTTTDLALRGLENQMALLHGARIIPGDRDMPDDGSGVLYHVTVSVEQMNDQKNQPVPNMLRATITATWKTGSQENSRSVSELIYQP